MSRRGTDINPTGTGVGQNFLIGLQERNRNNLLEIFKAATPVLKEIAKVKPESWRNMKGLFKTLEGTFGIQRLGAGFTKPLSMLQTRAENAFSGLLGPITVQINNLANQVERLALANPEGAITGAVIGGFLGSFIGHPQLGALFGSLLFSSAQGIVADLTGTGGTPIDIDEQIAAAGGSKVITYDKIKVLDIILKFNDPVPRIIIPGARFKGGQIFDRF